MNPATQPTHLRRQARPFDPGAVSPGFGDRARRLAPALLPIALLLIVCLPALTYRLGVYPPIWFDEGYRTNAARALAVTGVFGTSTIDGLLPYDTGISTGPADILPLALSYRLLGPGIAQARVVSVAYSVLAVVALYAVARRLFGRTAGLFSVLFVLIFPSIQGVSLLLIGRQVMGEPPALALVSLGIWLWLRSWSDRNTWMAVASGLCLGLGVLSKTQVIFGLLPALMAIALLRSHGRKGWLVSNLPWITMMLVLAGWALWSGLDSPADIRLRNAQMLAEAVRTQLLAGQWGRGLDRSALAISLLMMMAALVETGRLLRHRRGPGFPTDADWGSGLLVLFVFFSCIWFALFSIGWPRYATIGFIFALLLLGRLAWDAVRFLASRLGARSAGGASRIEIAGIALLGLIALPLNLVPVHQFQPTSDAQAAADFVSANIPRDAVVESWTWELDALTDHWRFHHPDLSYLYLAERQEFLDRVPFSLGYDTLQADPDFLISGPFSQWVSLYDPAAIRDSFHRVASFGPYVIYKRAR
jgi:4-amino-4-deoxy-L-arabinose transferase-like glycosyltransferase